MKPDRALTLVGAIFAPIGAIFLTIGIVLMIKLPADERLAFIVFPILGGIFFILGCVLIISSFSKSRRNAALLENGEPVSAEILDVERNFNVEMNGRNPYRVVCRYYEDGTAFICRSENIWEYPELSGNTVTVWRDPADRKKYFVDLENVLIPSVTL